MELTYRRLREDEYEDSCRVVSAAFGEILTAEDLEREMTVAEPDRVFGAFDGQRLVGANGAMTFQLAVPGGVTEAAGITGVGVLPTHRRRGINRELMRLQLDDARLRREPTAALFASEGGIYGRFGYGIATWDLMLEAEAHRTSYVRGYRPSGSIELLPRDEALPIIHEVYRREGADRPGTILVDARTLAWHHWQKKDDDTPKCFAVHRDSGTGEPDGYAVYRTSDTKWEDGVAKQGVDVHAAHALTPGAYADIWRFLFDIDLVDRVRAVLRPADEPLMYLTEEPNRLHTKIGHGLWLRLIDVPAALRARSYAGPMSLVFDIDDAFCPWNAGRHRVVVDPEGAVRVEPTSDAPDLSCSASALGAVYLGGGSFRRLQRAGQVVGYRPGSLAVADAAFGWDPVPWSSIMF